MRKAQIKMFETIGVLIVFFFLLIAGTVFYFNIQKSAMSKELAQQAQLRSLQAAQRATYLPELDCSFARVTQENCFDRHKLSILAAATRDHQETYFRLFGFANVTVTEAYPATEPFRVTVYDNAPDEYSRMLKNQFPVLLYDPVSRAYSFGVMEVATYAAR